jgi:hypothetical protein
VQAANQDELDNNEKAANQKEIDRVAKKWSKFSQTTNASQVQL